jgi:hypothetical protein
VRAILGSNRGCRHSGQCGDARVHSETQVCGITSECCSRARTLQRNSEVCAHGEIIVRSPSSCWRGIRPQQIREPLGRAEGVTRSGRFPAVCVLVVGCAASAPPQAGPQPIQTVALVWPSYPSNLNVGWYAPLLVVYSNGLAIVEVEGGTGALPAFRSQQFTASELDRFQDDVARDSAFWTFWGSDDSIDLAKDASDAIDYLITVALPGREKTVVVRGGDWDSRHSSFAPFALRDLYRRLAGSESGGGRAWLPDSVEVVLHPARTEYCPDPSRGRPGDWPTALPLPPNPAENAAGELRFRLPVSHYQAVVELREKHGNDFCAPLRYDSRYWLLGFRFPFPSEDRWPL